jgi:hypothetical protein
MYIPLKHYLFKTNPAMQNTSLFPNDANCIVSTKLRTFKSTASVKWSGRGVRRAGSHYVAPRIEINGTTGDTIVPNFNLNTSMVTDDPSSLTVGMLKDKLRIVGLKLDGTKADLVRRLRNFECGIDVDKTTNTINNVQQRVISGSNKYNRNNIAQLKDMLTIRSIEFDHNIKKKNYFTNLLVNDDFRMVENNYANNNNEVVGGGELHQRHDHDNEIFVNYVSNNSRNNQYVDDNFINDEFSDSDDSSCLSVISCNFS